MSDPAMAILSAQDLGVTYGPCPILHSIEFSLQQGDWISVIGPNGSGKSTLLKSLSGMVSLQKGGVWLDGKAIHSLAPKVVAQQLALVSQHQELPEGLTVEHLVSLGRSPYQNWWTWRPSVLDQEKISWALHQTHLVALRHRSLETLSGGERQRAFLALALAQDPQVLLLDEPTTFLDLRYQLEVLEVIKHLNQTQTLAVITVLHDINLAARYSDQLALMDRGQLRMMGSPTEVLRSKCLEEVFGIEVSLVSTPIGPQITPLGIRSSGPEGEQSPLTQPCPTLQRS